MLQMEIRAMIWVAQEIEGEMMPFISVTREKRNKREYLSPLGGHFLYSPSHPAKILNN